MTAQGGRSGVVGGAVPEAGAIALDLTGLSRVIDVDEISSTVRVEAGVFGPDLEAALRARTASRSATFPSPSISPPSADGSRAAARVSTRTATARSKTSCEHSRSSLRTVTSSSSAVARRVRPLDPTSCSSSLAPRARSASSPKRRWCCDGAHRYEARRAYGFATFARRTRRVSAHRPARGPPRHPSPLRRASSRSETLMSRVRADRPRRRRAGLR